MIDVADGNTVYYYHFDGVGSVIALSDVNKVIVERYSYDVFGEPNRTSDVNNPYHFQIFGKRIEVPHWAIELIRKDLPKLIKKLIK